MMAIDLDALQTDLEYVIGDDIMPDVMSIIRRHVQPVAPVADFFDRDDIPRVEKTVECTNCGHPVWFISGENDPHPCTDCGTVNSRTQPTIGEEAPVADAALRERIAESLWSSRLDDCNCSCDAYPDCVHQYDWYANKVIAEIERTHCLIERERWERVRELAWRYTDNNDSNFGLEPGDLDE